MKNKSTTLYNEIHTEKIFKMRTFVSINACILSDSYNTKFLYLSIFHDFLPNYMYLILKCFLEPVEN